MATKETKDIGLFDNPPIKDDCPICMTPENRFLDRFYNRDFYMDLIRPRCGALESSTSTFVEFRKHFDYFICDIIVREARLVNRVKPNNYL